MFNPALLEIDHPVDVDIHQFNRANSLPAGNYKVSIYVNGEYVDRREVTFSKILPPATCILASQTSKPCSLSLGSKWRLSRPLTT